jgi:hypothetical protein
MNIRVNRRAAVLGAAAVFTRSRAAGSSVLAVGPQRAIQTLAEAARVARDGDVVQVDAGEYRADVAVWTQHALTLRAVGGRACLWADGAAAEGKAIWVVRAQGMVVQGFDFNGCRVAGRNGAGIRFESGSLGVSDCRFVDNEMGLLTANDPTQTLEVRNSEFAHNQRPDGHNHNLYAGSIARLVVSGCWLHHGHIGHLLKSRAADNHIVCNLLADGDGGSASYELEFANGGQALVLGNVIQQSQGSGNPRLVSFGAEGLKWPRNALLMAHNTFIDDTGRGTLVRAAPGTAPLQLLNNLWQGSERIEAAGAELRNNFAVTGADFEPGPVHERRLLPRSPAFGRAVEAGDAVRLVRQYQHPRGCVALAGAARDPGAKQAG